MGQATDQLTTLLDDTAFRVLVLLAGSTSPVSGRAVARSLTISPTTASAALTKLGKAGFATSIDSGRAKTWYLDENHPTIRGWLQEANGMSGDEFRSNRSQLTAVIFTALQEEYAAVVAHLPDRRAARVGTTRYETATFAGIRADWIIYVAEIGAGNASTAIELTSAMRLGPHLVCFVGVAGSVKPEDLCRGDVVVAERVYNLHAGKDKWTEKAGSTHQPRPLSYPAAHGAIQLVRSVRQKDWTSEIVAANPTADPVNGKGTRPRVEIRAIAAGEVVHADDRSELMEKLRTGLGDVAAVDMESFGLYEAAHVHELPALAIRGISDCVGDKVTDLDLVWQPRAASHAAAFTFALLRYAEPDDLQARGLQVPPSDGSNGDPSPREMLFRLPPPVAVVFDWALTIVGERASAVLRDLSDLGGQPATWLSRFRHRVPAPFRTDDSGPLWVLVAEFADSHGHPTTSWLYEKAADRFDDRMLRAYLFSRASWTASRRVEKSDELLNRAQALEPTGQLLWEFIRAVIGNQAGDVLIATPPIAAAFQLGLSRSLVAALGAPQSEAVDDLAQFADAFAERHPGLFEQARLTVAVNVVAALQTTGQFDLAQILLDGLAVGLSAYGDSQPGSSALGSLVGPRSSTVLLRTAINLYMRVTSPSNREPGLNRDAMLNQAVELALTARDRRRDWGGPTGEPLAIAAQARAASGDRAGALRLVLPPPVGTAGSAEAASQPVVQAAAVLAVGSGNVELALELGAKIEDEIEKRLVTALALSLRQDSHPEAASEYRSALLALGASDRVDQQIRALLGLAMVSDLRSEELSRLENLDPESADLIRAQSFLTAGRTSEAQVLARRYPDSDAAVQIRVNGLMSQGKVTDAIVALEAHGNRQGSERWLEQAAVIALSSGLTSETNRLASRLASSVDTNRRRVGREVLIDSASSSGDWATVLNETRRLLDDELIDQSDPDRNGSITKYRWSRAHALYQLRRLDEAYEVIREHPRLTPADLKQAQLTASILRMIAPSVIDESPDSDGGTGITQAEILAAVVEVAQAFPEDEELVATAVITSLSLPSIEPPDPLLMTKARQLQQQFFEHFPESQVLQRIPLDDSFAGLTEVLRTNLAPGLGQAEQLRRRALVGQLPIGVYAASLRRNYAEGLVRNAVGCYVIRGVDDRIRADEIEAARDSLDRAVVVDTSALFLSEATLGGASELRAHFERLIAASPQRDEILTAKTSLAIRSVGSLGWDRVSNHPIAFEYGAVVTDQWAEDAARLASALEFCEVVEDPPFDGDRGNRAWSSAIRVAGERGLSLIADDAALRLVARTEGVSAFGTFDLLSVLIEAGRLPGEALDNALERLKRIRAAELPLLDQLIEIAENEDWQPTGYAGFLMTRPVTWIPLSVGLQKYMELIRALPEQDAELVAGWCATALFGLCLISPAPMVPIAAGTLLAWTTLELDRPDILPALLAEAELVVRQFLPDVDLVKEVVQRLVITVRQVTPPDLVPHVILSVLAGLDGEVHTQAVAHFLATP